MSRMHDARGISNLTALPKDVKLLINVFHVGPGCNISFLPPSFTLHTGSQEVDITEAGNYVPNLYSVIGGRSLTIDQE